MNPVRYKNYEIEISSVSGQYDLRKLGEAVNQKTGEKYESKTSIAYDVPLDYAIERIIKLEVNENDNESLQELLATYKVILEDLKGHFSKLKTA